MMTFNDLHNDIEEGCDCLSQKPLSQNPEASFVRAIKKRTVSPEDFRSHRERNIRMRIAARGCSTECQYRGVSMNKLDNNAAAIRSYWEAVSLISPRGVRRASSNKFVCAFSIKEEAGKIWDTSNNKPEAHYTLLKADAFSLELISVKEVIPVSQF
jgi:hypothetical protein